MINPLSITRDVKTKNCNVFYNFLRTLLEKSGESEDETDKRIGIATSMLLNLANKDLNIYAEKLGVMLVASGGYHFITIIQYKLNVDLNEM